MISTGDTEKFQLKLSKLKNWSHSLVCLLWNGVSCTSEGFEFVLEVKFLSSQPGQVNSEVGADGVLF